MRPSFGQKRVGALSNPSGSYRVAEIKRKASDLIDVINDVVGEDADGEVRRCAALAMTHFETGCMFAVKAITMPVEDEDGDQ